MTTNALMELADRLAAINWITPEQLEQVADVIGDMRELATQLRTAASGVGHDRARATSRRIGATEILQKMGWKWDGCVWFAPSVEAVQKLNAGAEARDAERLDFIERTLMEGGAVWILPSGPDMAFAQVRSFGDCDNFPVAEGGARAAIDAALRARE